MTLFLEIASAHEGASQSSRSSYEEIQAHLRQLCSQRLDTLLLAPDFGVGDLTNLEHSFAGTADAWRAHLEEAIRRYERRLRNPRVTLSVSQDIDVALRGEIAGVTFSGGREERVSYAFTIDGRGEVVLASRSRQASLAREGVRQHLLELGSARLHILAGQEAEGASSAHPRGPSLAERVATWAEDWREAIQRLERRLRHPTVAVTIADSYPLDGHVRGWLVLGGRVEPVAFRVRIDVHGKLGIR